MNIQLGFATFEVPSRIIDSLYLYETRLHIYKKGGDSIKSLLQIKYSKIDPENIPLTDSPGNFHFIWQTLLLFRVVNNSYNYFQLIISSLFNSY